MPDNTNARRVLTHGVQGRFYRLTGRFMGVCERFLLPTKELLVGGSVNQCRHKLQKTASLEGLAPVSGFHTRGSQIHHPVHSLRPFYRTVGNRTLSPVKAVSQQARVRVWLRLLSSLNEKLFAIDSGITHLGSGQLSRCLSR